MKRNRWEVHHITAHLCIGLILYTCREDYKLYRVYLHISAAVRPIGLFVSIHTFAFIGKALNIYAYVYPNHILL